MTMYDCSHIAAINFAFFYSYLTAVMHQAHSTDHSLYAQAGHIGYLLACKFYFAARLADIVIGLFEIGYQRSDPLSRLTVKKLPQQEKLKPQPLRQQF